MANTYLPGWAAMMGGAFALDAVGDIKACLVEANCTFTETHATLDVVLAVGSGELDASSGYARQTLAGNAIAVAGGKAKFSSSNVTFTDVDSADTAAAMIIYWDGGGGDSTCVPLCYSDGADEVFTAGNLKTLVYNCPATGWMNVANS